MIALGYRKLPGRARRAGSAPAAIGLAFLSAIGALVQLQDKPDEHRAAHLVAVGLRHRAAGLDIKLGDPRRPAVGLHGLVVTGVSTLIHLYSVAYMTSDRGYARYFSYLNFFVFSMLLLVLAGNFVLLIVGWAFVGFASYALISFWYRRGTATKAGHEGVRDQRGRRRRPGARRDPHLPRARHLRLPRRVRGGAAARSRRTRG